jgi:hypothetical protein
MEEPDVSGPGRLHDSAPTIQDLFEKFQREYWPNYETEGGQKEYRNYYKLVLMTSVLRPEHYYH